MGVGGSSRGPWGHQVSLLVPSPGSELISWWSEAVPGAPGGTRLLCLFLHLSQSSSRVWARPLFVFLFFFGVFFVFFFPAFDAGPSEPVPE